MWAAGKEGKNIAHFRASSPKGNGFTSACSEELALLRPDVRLLVNMLSLHLFVSVLMPAGPDVLDQ